MAAAVPATLVVTAATPATAVVAAAAVPPAVTGFTTIWGVTINPSVIVFCALAATIVYALWKAQRSDDKNTFNVWDLIQDVMPDGSRRTSGIKASYQFAFILSSWVVMDNQIKHTLTEGIFGLYLGTWCASLIAKVIFDAKGPIAMPEHMEKD